MNNLNNLYNLDKLFNYLFKVVELGHFDKHLVKNTRKRGPAGPQGSILEFFLLDTLKSTF